MKHQMKLIVYAIAMLSTFSQRIVSGQGGSYNAFLKQVGYCKQQSYDTVSRSTSHGPYIFTSGQVELGVGLSDTQFAGSIVSCGRCINVVSIDPFYTFNEEVTEWDYRDKKDSNFTVMVMDQCTDAICQSGFLDFDIYNQHLPVAYGNPMDLVWEFVECPVGNTTMEFLFCLGGSSCNPQDPENRTVEELYEDSKTYNWFSLYPRNFRIPITSIRVQGIDLVDKNAWIWKGVDILRETKWTIEWTSEDGSIQSWVVDWNEHFDKYTTPGYRGGIILSTDKQN